MNKKGFTLIEIVVVMAIIAVLAALVTGAIVGARKQMRDTQRISDFRNLRIALEVYYGAHLRYPIMLNYQGHCSDFGGKANTGVDGWIPNLAPNYINELPTDPNQQDTGWHCYLYYSDGSDYKLLAHGTPEDYSINSPYYDPVRPTWAWQISTSDYARTNW